MGKTKVKIIDDSAQEENKESRIKNKASKRKVEKEQTLDDRKVEDSTLKIEGGELKEENPPSTLDLQDSTINPPSSTVKKAQRPGKAKPRSKKYKQSLLFFDKKSQAVDEPNRGKLYSIPEAVETVKKLSYSKFAGTLEAHVNTTQTGIRGLVTLPYAAGRKLRILAFGKGAEQSGADIVGDEETLENISQGKIDFDIIVVSPEWMPKIAKVAKILGPKGLMPNPKNGTITEDLKKTVAGFQAGKTEYKTEAKAAVIHLGLGKLNQPTEELSANVKTLLQTLGKTRVKKVFLSPTMGPSVKVDLASI